MTWTVHFEESEGYIVVETHGVFTVADHLRMIDDILSRPFWRPGMAALFDHRDLDLVGATYDTMRKASENHVRHDDRIGSGKAAILMGGVADFGSARQFELIVEGQASASLRVFLDADAARGWVAS